MAKGTFFNRKIHSLFGVLPVGIFLVFHLMTNYQATKGPEAYNTAAAAIGNLPFLIILEVVLIFLPLLFHAIYGLYVMYQASINLHRFNTFRNWMFVLQRVTGILTLIFVAWHVWEARINRPADPDFYQLMSQILSDPFMYWFYVIGIVAAGVSLLQRNVVLSRLLGRNGRPAGSTSVHVCMDGCLCFAVHRGD